MIKSFKEFLMEQIDKPIPTPPSLVKLNDFLCGDCFIHETEHMNFCSEFGVFCSSIQTEMMLLSAHFTVDMDLFRNNQYNSIEGVKGFVRDVLTLFNRIKKHREFIVQFTTGDTITHDVRDSVECYNKFASKMNNYSSKLFTLLKTEKSDCEKVEITKQFFEDIFTGKEVLKLIDISKKEVVASTVTFP